MRLAAAALLACAFCLGQNAGEEQQALSRALGETGGSPLEIIRALETHLAKYLESARKPDLERALLKAAMEVRDDRRIILYGEQVLQREQNDLQALERVARALLASDAKEPSERALKYARRYGEVVSEMRTRPVNALAGKAQWEEELDRGAARALSLQARATGNTGKVDEAITLARKSYETFPLAEGARETGRWLARAGQHEEAARYYAEAFALAGADADRAADRKLMGELYRKSKGSERGLGDVLLAAYDRVSSRAAERQSRLEAADPNAQATEAMEFTLSSLNGEKLKLASLRGKAIVFDFWATWCAPCRAQHPLYEAVKARYRFNPDVVFLSVNTDEDRSLVEPFLKENKWTQAVYFEDGMARKLAISSIPTTLVVGRNGEVVSRMNGYVPERFVDMLSERIEEALK
jgi:thiol-disulfide isomerase/thioredoxin